VVYILHTVSRCIELHRKIQMFCEHVQADSPYGLPTFLPDPRNERAIDFYLRGFRVMADPHRGDIWNASRGLMHYTGFRLPEAWMETAENSDSDL
jgi:hypothetical protein